MSSLLFELKGLTVSALTYSGILLMGAHIDSIQGAVVLRTTVMLTLLNGASDRSIGVGTIHCVLPPFMILIIVWPAFRELYCNSAGTL